MRMVLGYVLAAVLMVVVVVLFFRRPFTPLATTSVIGSIVLVTLGGAADEQGWIVSETTGLILLGAAVVGIGVLAVQPRRRVVSRPVTGWARGWHAVVGGAVAAALSLGVYFAMSAVALSGSGPGDPLLNESTVSVVLLTPFLLVLGVVFGFSYSPEDARPLQDAQHTAPTRS